MEAHLHHHHEQQQNQAKEKSAETKQFIKDHDHHHNQDHHKSPPAQPVTISPASPPSSSSSPSHEFSFTISLHSSTISTTTSSSIHNKNTKLAKTNNNKNTNSNNNNNTPQNSSLAIDLSPADDIFFHGHLLPLHLLSHLPVSPRSSTNSLDSFTLPIKDLASPQDPPKETKIPEPTPTTTSSRNNNSNNNNNNNNGNRPKSFSLFGLGKWKRGTYEFRDRADHHQQGQEKQQPKRKLRFDVSHVLKRYMRMVRPLLFFRRRRDGRRNGIHFQRQPYSFSGILSSRNSSNGSIGRKTAGGYSAPASMRTSPSNSGLLVATTTTTATLHSSASDSTMEELQAAIQAAIAHCKNSIATDRDSKVHKI